MATDGDFFELHDIGGQGACLVREDVVNLSEFLIEIGRLDESLLLDSVGTLVHSLVVVRDLDTLNVLDHLKGDEEGDGNEIREDENPGAPFFPDHVIERVEVMLEFTLLGAFPEVASQGSCET